MATFLERVQAVSGTVSASGELSTWLSDGVIDVMRRIYELDNRHPILYRFASNVAVGSAGLTMDTGAFVLDVQRDGYEALETDVQLRHRADRTGSYYKATVKHPVYYGLNNTIHVLPVPTVTATASASYIAPSTVAHGDTAIANFPSELYPAVVLYGSIQNLQAKISDLSFPSDVSLPTPPSLDTLVTVSESLPTWNDVPEVALVSAPIDADIDFTDEPTNPTFTAPDAIVLPTAPTLDLTVDKTLTDAVEAAGVVLPDFAMPAVPTIADLTIAASAPSAPSAPSYSVPSMTTPGGLTVPSVTAPASLSVPSMSTPSTIVPTVHMTAGLPTYTKPTSSLSFATAMGTITTQITTDEDVSLAAHKINQVQAAVQAYVSDIQNEFNKFNMEVEKYKTELSKEVQEAQLSLAEEEKEAQLIISQEAQLAGLVMSQEEKDAQLLMAKEAKEGELLITQETTDGQLLITQEEKEAMLILLQEDKEYVASLVKYQNEISQYVAEVGAEVQEYTINEIQNEIQIWIIDAQTKIAAYQAEAGALIQKHSNVVSSKLGLVQSEVALYGAELQKLAALNGNKIQSYGVQSSTQINRHATELNEQTQEFMAELQVWNGEIQKAIALYQTETGYDLSKFSAQVSAAIQEHAQDLSNESTRFQGELQKYRGDLEYVGSYNTVRLQKFAHAVTRYQLEFTAQLGNYNAKIAQRQSERDKYEKEYAALRVQYEQVFVPFQSSSDRGTMIKNPII